MTNRSKISGFCSWIARAVATAIIGGVALSGGEVRAVEMSAAAKAVVDYDKSFTAPSKKFRIAYLTECVDNPYCLARLEGLKDAAKKFGFGRSTSSCCKSRLPTAAT